MTNFLLQNATSRRLYEEIAAPLPIIDYHTHLCPNRFVRNEPFETVDELWIVADPYKWRAMRMNGVPEQTITGDASPEERFRAWAATLPKLAGNPLSHWSRMELAEFFDIDEPLTPANADSIYARCNQRLGEPDFRPQELLARANVEVVMTSDDWLDDLAPHRQAARENLVPRLLPSLRADTALAVGSPGFPQFTEDLAVISGQDTGSLDGYLLALENRLEFFAQAGCRIADHGIDHLQFTPCTSTAAAKIYARACAGEDLGQTDLIRLRSYLLVWLAGAYARRGWTLLLHLGAQRQTSTRLAQSVGKAGGYAAIGSSLEIDTLTTLLNAMEREGGLPRVILFPLNPNDFEPVASLCGAFVEDGVPGKVQLGPAWWYNDHRDGIERQLRAVANHAALGVSLGMTTDSRSYLSSIRHDYFRRVLCNLLGQWIEDGELPEDDGALIRAICHENARDMLGLDL